MSQTALKVTILLVLALSAVATTCTNADMTKSIASDCTETVPQNPQQCSKGTHWVEVDWGVSCANTRLLNKWKCFSDNYCFENSYKCKDFNPATGGCVVCYNGYYLRQNTQQGSWCEKSWWNIFTCW